MQCSVAQQITIRYGVVWCTSQPLKNAPENQTGIVGITTTQQYGDFQEAHLTNELWKTSLSAAVFKYDNVKLLFTFNFYNRHSS